MSLPATITAIMPNYNYAHYLLRAIEAIATQSRPPDEMLIVDDCSTDNSRDVICSYANRYPFIRFVQNETNCGVSLTCNRMAKEARGDYLYFGSADDYVLPGFFEKTLALVSRYPQAGMCCGDPAWFDEPTGASGAAVIDWARGHDFMSPGRNIAKACWKLYPHAFLDHQARPCWKWAVIRRSFAGIAIGLSIW